VALVVDVVWVLRAPPNDPQVNAIIKQGYPVTLAELDGWYRSPAPEQNAAFAYTNAFARLTGLTNFLDGWSPRAGEPIEPEDLSELKAVLETNRAALQLLHSALSRTNSRYPIDLKQGFNTLLPHLARVKQGTLLLTAEALAAVAEHRNEDAVQSLLAAGHLADSLAAEPTLISQLVRFGAWVIVCTRLENVLNATSLSEEQLSALQTMVTAGEKPRSFARAIAGERASGYDVFVHPHSQGMIFGSGAATTGWRSIGPRLFVGLLKTTGMFAKDRRFFLDAMSTNVAIGELPFPEQFKSSQSTPPPIPSSRFYVVSRILLSGLSTSRTTTRHGNCVAWLRITQTALAVQRYRLAHRNSLPDDLSQLAPEFLAAVPDDPYDGKPLRFRRLSSGFVVYSIGSDGRDDGGTPFSTKRGSPSDITITVGK
jgi:hypothetical protein